MFRRRFWVEDPAVAAASVALLLAVVAVAVASALFDNRSLWPHQKCESTLAADQRAPRAALLPGLSVASVDTQDRPLIDTSKPANGK